MAENGFEPKSPRALSLTVRVLATVPSPRIAFSLNGPDCGGDLNVAKVVTCGSDSEFESKFFF